MKCPKCNVELIKGKVHKEKNGTEYFEMECPKCKGRFIDLKMPYSAFEEHNSTTKENHSNSTP